MLKMLIAWTMIVHQISLAELAWEGEPAGLHEGGPGCPGVIFYDPDPLWKEGL